MIKSSYYAIINHFIGNRLDDVAAKYFIKIYDRKLLLDPAKGDDLFDDWVVALHSKFLDGQKPLLDQLAADAGTVQRIEAFLKPPSEFSSWKAGFETADQFGNTARGRMIQVYEAHHGALKNWKNLDTIDHNGVVRHSKGLDFQSKTNPGLYAELKTTAVPDPQHLIKQLRNSALEVSERGGHTLEFHVHWLKNNGRPNFTKLIAEAQKINANNPNLNVKIIDTGSEFQNWK